MTNLSIKIFYYFKKFPLFSFLPFLVLGILFFPHSARAAVWDWITGAIMGLPNMFVMLILQVVLLISGLLSSLVGGLLNFIISPDFIRWSYTRPGDPSVDPTNNPVILAGLSVTQSFVNMILVLILVYIAFQTILRIGGVKTQKLLVNLVIIALLINFAPVLIGLVVDASNILMHYFTAPLTGSKNFINTLNDIGNNLATYFTSGMLSLTKQLDIIMQTVVLIVFNFVLIMILGMFCLIFIARYVAIWMLVILSPLAFVAYILPQTKKFFDQWLNQLMQWCFIGVTGGFFLYLAEKVQESVQTLNIKFDSGFVFFNALLPNIIPLIFIVAGFILSLKTGAMGADKIVEFGKKAGKNVGNFAARRSKAFIGDKIPKDVRQSLQGLASSANPAWGKSQKGISGWAKRTMASVVGDAQRTVGISGMRGITKSEQEAAKTAHDEAMKRGVDENLGVMRTRGKTKAEKAAIISAIMDKKQIGHATDDKFVTSPLSDEEMIDAYGYYTQAEDSDAIEKLEGGNIRNKTGILKEFARIKDATTANFLSTDPDKLIGGIDEDDRKEYGTLQNKIIARAKSEEDIKQLQKGWWKDSALMEAANKFWGGNQVSTAGRNLGRDFTDALQKFADDKGVDWYINPAEGKNLALPRYLASSAAQGLGMSPLKGGEDIKNINRLTQRYAQSKLTGTDKIIEDIGKLNDRLRELSSKPARTQADIAEMGRLRHLIDSIADANDLQVSQQKRQKK